VRVLSRDRGYPAGESSIRWDGRDDDGVSVASGVYFVKLRTELGERVRRAVLLK
jgi:flagellar hook assembly protein FlgD